MDAEAKAKFDKQWSDTRAEFLRACMDSMEAILKKTDPDITATFVELACAKAALNFAATMAVINHGTKEVFLEGCANSFDNVMQLEAETRAHFSPTPSQTQ